MVSEVISRIERLEYKMDIIENTTIRKIEKDLEILKQNQFKFFERFSSLEERFSALQAHMDERISNLQTRTDERITALHGAIVVQTRWFIAAVLSGALLLSTLPALIQKFF